MAAAVLAVGTSSVDPAELLGAGSSGPLRGGPSISLLACSWGVSLFRSLGSADLQSCLHGGVSTAVHHATSFHATSPPCLSKSTLRWLLGGCFSSHCPIIRGLFAIWSCFWHCRGRTSVSQNESARLLFLPSIPCLPAWPCTWLQSQPVSSAEFHPLLPMNGGSV